MTRGLVYLAQITGGEPHESPVKIGFTSASVGSRIATLQIGSPYGIALLGTVEGTHQDEHRYHRIYSYARIRGEWFRPTPSMFWEFGVEWTSRWPDPAIETEKKRRIAHERLRALAADDWATP